MRRGLCFCAGLTLALAAILCAVLLPATSAARFERALLTTVDAPALGVTRAELSAFAADTMAYLRGERAQWTPTLGLPIPQSFRAHMAEVRGWVKAAPWVIVAGVALFAGLLLAGGRMRAPALRGVAFLLLLLAAAVLWALLDFDSLWMLLHRALIPGGIFPAGEPIKRLFPLALFFQYLPSVCALALGCLAAACGLILTLTRKGTTQR